MSLAYLQLLHQYLDMMCKRPFPDEDVYELRRRRRQVAELIADWPDR